MRFLRAAAPFIWGSRRILCPFPCFWMHSLNFGVEIIWLVEGRGVLSAENLLPSAQQDTLWRATARKLLNCKCLFYIALE